MDSWTKFLTLMKEGTSRTGETTKINLRAERIIVICIVVKRIVNQNILQKCCYKNHKLYHGQTKNKDAIKLNTL
jgi:hypothetical protein